MPFEIVERVLVRPLRRLLSWRRDTDGRVVLFTIVAGCLSTIAAARLIWGVDLWPWLGVPPGPSLFFDARNLTAAWDCQRLGYDPLYENPCDPRGRPLMYLRPWLLFGFLGLGQSHTVILSIVLIGAMFSAFAALVRRVPAGAGIVLGAAACSPAIMLAIERANMDIALVSLVSAAILLWRAVPGVSSVVGPAMVLFAATAKLYPVFALPAFVMARERLAARVALLCLVGFAIYFVISFRDVAHAAAIAIQGDHFSYGARILPAHLYHQVGADHWAGPRVLKQLIALVPVAVMAATIAVRVHRQLGQRDDQIMRATAGLLGFHAGALIYLGTFAVANNFDYRLVFLLLTFPQLVEWSRAPTHRLSSLAAVTLVGVVVLLWVGSLSEQLNLWDELASWGVAALLGALVVATMPDRKVLRMVFSSTPQPHPPEPVER